MSHHQADGHASKSNPIKMAIIIAVGTLVVIIGIVLLAEFAVDTYALGTDAKTASPEETAKRIAPVARLVVGTGAEPAATPATSAPAAIPVAAVSTGKPDGKAVYASACAACHTAGVAGAPKLGDKAIWAVRLKTGTEALYASAIKGKGIMPAKGGNMALADADVRASVDYLIAQSK